MAVVLAHRIVDGIGTLVAFMASRDNSTMKEYGNAGYRCV
jgi:hypothetical protein